jgi:UDP-N-acetylglucosamine 2-epimerase
MITVVTIAGIRPDFIRFNHIYKALDNDPGIFHVLVHSGQHYDLLLSDIFFEELNIREPDYNLHCGAPGKEHFELSGDITKAIIKLLRERKIKPDIILFLGDTNSVVCSVGLKKEGYTLGHIEAGMRSYDRRMLEEINRTVCDHCCDYHFTYHEDYSKQLRREGIRERVFMVGNTIVEVCKEVTEDLFKTKSARDQIIMDIHRPENFKYPHRMKNIIDYANRFARIFNVPVKMLKFGRTLQYMHDSGITPGEIQLIDMLSYKKFLAAQYHSLFVFSDSGTAQEEAALLGTPVVVPRDYTERPQSMESNCSILLNVEEEPNPVPLTAISNFIDDVLHGEIQMRTRWLGDGTTSKKIVQILKRYLEKT